MSGVRHAFVLLLFSFGFLFSTASAATTASNGEFCGGIAAIQCADGLECVLEGTYPDAGGTCMPDTGYPGNAETTFDLNLIAGWNLVSLPIAQSVCPIGAQCLTAPRVPVVSTTCQASVLHTFSYDSVSRKYTQAPLTLSLITGGSASGVQTIFPSGFPMRGYWVYSTDACKVTIAGSPFSVEQIGAVLSEGWNLLGASTATVTWNDVRGQCQATRGPYAYDAASKRYVLTHVLDAGKGYFVKVPLECRMARALTLSEKRACQADAECELQPTQWCECGVTAAVNRKYFTPVPGQQVALCPACPSGQSTRAVCQNAKCTGVPSVTSGGVSACPVSDGDDLTLNAPDGTAGQNLNLTLTLGGTVVRSSSGIEIWKLGTTFETAGKYIFVTTVGRIEESEIGCATVSGAYAPPAAGEYKAIFHYKISRTTGDRQIQTDFTVS